MPVSPRLYPLLLLVLAYAFLGAGPRMVIGPEGTVALLVATEIAPLAPAGSMEYAALAAMLEVLIGYLTIVGRPGVPPDKVPVCGGMLLWRLPTSFTGAAPWLFAFPSCTVPAARD